MKLYLFLIDLLIMNDLLKINHCYKNKINYNQNQNQIF